MAKQIIVVQANGPHRVGSSMCWSYIANETEIKFQHPNNALNFTAPGNYLEKEVMVFLNGVDSRFIGERKAPVNPFRRAFWEIGIYRARLHKSTPDQLKTAWDELSAARYEDIQKWQKDVPGTGWFEKNYDTVWNGDDLVGVVGFSRNWHRNNQRWHVDNVFYLEESLEIGKELIEKIKERLHI